MPAAKIKGDKQYSIVTDYLGTPIQMYDEQGEKTWDCTLDVYGKVANFEGCSLSDCPFRYQGQYEDEETGLYYNRFRFYDPDMGGYISQDPIRLLGGLSFYQYVCNVNIQLDILGLITALLTYNHKLKAGKVTDIAELTRQMDEQIEAMNKILKEEGIEGLKKRVSDYGPEIEKAGRNHTASLGSAGDGKVWAHTPDMRTGGSPTSVSPIPAGARENSILGGGNARRISQDIQSMGNDVTEVEGKIHLH